MIVMRKICEIIISKVKLNKNKPVSDQNRYVKKKTKQNKKTKKRNKIREGSQLTGNPFLAVLRYQFNHVTVP